VETFRLIRLRLRLTLLWSCRHTQIPTLQLSAVEMDHTWTTPVLTSVVQAEDRVYAIFNINQNHSARRGSQVSCVDCAVHHKLPWGSSGQLQLTRGFQDTLLGLTLMPMHLSFTPHSEAVAAPTLTLRISIGFEKCVYWYSVYECYAAGIWVWRTRLYVVW
jgi:hypothetical protein